MKLTGNEHSLRATSELKALNTCVILELVVRKTSLRRTTRLPKLRIGHWEFKKSRVCRPDVESATVCDCAQCKTSCRVQSQAQVQIWPVRCSDKPKIGITKYCACVLLCVTLNRIEK